MVGERVVYVNRLGFEIFSSKSMTRPYREIPLRTKFNNRTTKYGGRMYPSIAEANYAAQLDWRKKAGEVKEWEPQKKYELRVNGHLVTTHYLDFRVVLADGSVELVEVKGYATSEWRLKRNLLLALLNELEPDGAEYIVVKAYGRQGSTKFTKNKAR